jgi:hypothetical protein
LVFVGVGALALVPPRSSVLPPGAGNEPDEARKAHEKGPNEAEERGVDETAAVDREQDAATVRRDHDGDVAAIVSVQQAHAVSHRARTAGGRVERCPRSLPARMRDRQMTQMDALRAIGSRQALADELEERVGLVGIGDSDVGGGE